MIGRLTLVTLAAVALTPGVARIGSAAEPSEDRKAEPRKDLGLERADDKKSEKSDLPVDSGLEGLDAELRRPGHIATVNLPSGSGGLKSSRLAEPPEPKVSPVSQRPAPKGVAAKALQDDLVLEHRYAAAFAAIGNCPVEVARRRRVSPVDVQTGTVMFRWTLEASGQTRDMEAASLSPMDEAVITCALNVLSNWKLSDPVQRPVALERTFTFRRLGPVEASSKEP